MSKTDRVNLLCRIVLAAIAMSAAPASAQSPGSDPNAAPNAYRPDDAWAKQPMGRGFGMTIGINVDRDGRSM